MNNISEGENNIPNLPKEFLSELEAFAIANREMVSERGPKLQNAINELELSFLRREFRIKDEEYDREKENILKYLRQMQGIDPEES